MRYRSLIAGLAAGAALCGCASRVDPFGDGPSMTPPGAPRGTGPPAAPGRGAFARAQSAPVSDTIAAGSLWRSGPTSLFGDRRARGLGDIVTVVVEFQEEAQIDNRTNRQHQASEELSVPGLFGVPTLASRVLPGGASLDPAVDAQSTSTTNGVGTIQRQDRLALRVAATVVDVLPNGHLVIAGSQEVRVNNELRDLQVGGIIRLEDISRQNTITYEKIADARVLYGGRGTLSNIQQPRYGQRALDALLPF
ncbi:MAG: flagellar basal body L-ring protein FlgH [Pseudomonadota bacterium]